MNHRMFEICIPQVISYMTFHIYGVINGICGYTLYEIRRIYILLTSMLLYRYVDNHEE